MDLPDTKLKKRQKSYDAVHGWDRERNRHWRVEEDCELGLCWILITKSNVCYRLLDLTFL